MKIISESNPRITFGRTEIFADLEKKRRSGHLGHAMAECADGSILVLEFCNSTEKGFCCADPDCRYRLFASDDNGQSFYLYSTLEFIPLGHTYGNLLYRQDGALIFYGYNREDEYNLTGLISYDKGKTWSKDFKISVAKIARNPQVGCLNGRYILHGRSENMSNFVFYHSEDGLRWSEGTVVNEPLEGKPRVGCYYSNNLVIRGDDGKDRMLVQYSEQYCPNSGRFTVMHGWVECEYC